MPRPCPCPSAEPETHGHASCTHAAPRWHADAIASPLGAIDHQAHAHQLLQPLKPAPCLTDNMAKCHFLSFNCPCFTCPRRFPGVLTASSCFTWSQSLQRTGCGCAVTPQWHDAGNYAMQHDNASFQCSLINTCKGYHHQLIGTGVQTHSYSTVCMFVPDQMWIISWYKVPTTFKLRATADQWHPD